MLRYIVLLIVIAAAALEGPALLQTYMEQQAETDGRSGQTLRATREKPAGRHESNGVRGAETLEAGRDGHFRTDLRINNRWIKVLVDTGATAVSIPYEEAARLGLHPAKSDFTVQTRTANGIRYSALVNLDEVRIGKITLYDVDALISPPGALSTTLLGMSFLGRLRQVDMRDGRLVLVQ